MEYTTKGRLTMAEMGGQIFVAIPENVKWLKAYLERGEDVQLNPTKNRDTGEPWVFVNPPGGNPFSGEQAPAQPSTPPSTATPGAPLRLRPSQGMAGGPGQKNPVAGQPEPAWAIALSEKLDKALAGIARIEGLAS